MTRALEWLNRNSVRNYPFKEDVTRLTETNQEIPEDLLLDLTCFVPFREGAAYRVGQLDVTAGKIVITLFDDEDTPLGQTTILVTSHLPGAEYPIEPLKSKYVSGLLVAGRGVFTTVETFFGGKHPVSAEGGELEPSVTIPVDVGAVTSIGDVALPLTASFQGAVNLQGVRHTRGEGGGILVDVVNSETRALFPGPQDPKCLQISAVHQIPPQDCSFLLNGQPLLALEIPGVGSLGASAPGGGVTIDTQDIFYWQREGNKLLLKSWLDPEAQCIRPFAPHLRGQGGATGPRGPQGLAGEDVICECICPSCEVCDATEAFCHVCDQCEICDGGGCQVCDACEIELTDQCDTCDLVQAPDLTILKSAIIPDGIFVSDSIVLELGI